MVLPYRFAVARTQTVYWGDQRSATIEERGMACVCVHVVMGGGGGGGGGSRGFQKQVGGGVEVGAR